MRWIICKLYVKIVIVVNLIEYCFMGRNLHKGVDFMSMGSFCNLAGILTGSTAMYYGFIENEYAVAGVFAVQSAALLYSAKWYFDNGE